LRTTLEKARLAGVAKVVIRPPREHLAVVKPLDGILVLETMHFADELRDSDELRPPKASVGQKELAMAQTLVDAMTAKWDPQKYHDEYRESLLKIIDQKVKAGPKKLPAAKAPRPQGEKIIDLAELLQQSLQKSAQKKPKRTRTAHRKAA
jgi:DNA end-binding protein Ku